MMSPRCLLDWRCKLVAASVSPCTTCISIPPRSREDGDYATKDEGDPVAVAITYGYSRDHREDLKQWMLALATTHEGDMPLASRDLWMAIVQTKSI